MKWIMRVLKPDIVIWLVNKFILSHSNCKAPHVLGYLTECQHMSFSCAVW